MRKNAALFLSLALAVVCLVVLVKQDTKAQAAQKAPVVTTARDAQLRKFAADQLSEDPKVVDCVAVDKAHGHVIALFRRASDLKVVRLDLCDLIETFDMTEGAIHGNAPNH